MPTLRGQGGDERQWGVTTQAWGGTREKAASTMVVVALVVVAAVMVMAMHLCGGR